ncbi:hypothetical protein EWM64_g4781 [Hericium alpestre]|uniref:Uncharacterized protein n=1 Tax=Hericium alpestre TaxID=135208 RepID=A0A4Y9ZYW3_9AGAM|nr:hypothetical protein EWM64_g4781 [Hericium alpestre]
MSAAPRESTAIPASTDPYVRLVREDELDVLADLAADAFINDTMPHYFGGLKTPLADEPADSRTWRKERVVAMTV